MSEWPQVWSDCIKDAAVEGCTPEWLLWNRSRAPLEQRIKELESRIGGADKLISQGWGQPDAPLDLDALDRLAKDCLADGAEWHESKFLIEESFQENDSHFIAALSPDVVLRWLERTRRLEEALEGMAEQFAYWGKGGMITGGLSALEDAFEVLGWPEPRPCPAQTCDEPGCSERSTCGTPTPGGYRRVCGKHFAALSGGSDE